MWNFLFEFSGENSEYCGERIFVQCDTLEEAYTFMKRFYTDEEITYLGKYSDDEADEMGYDTY